MNRVVVQVEANITKNNPCEHDSINHDDDCEVLQEESDILLGSEKFLNENISFEKSLATDSLNERKKNMNDTNAIEEKKKLSAIENKGVQVTTECFNLTFSSFIKTEKDLITLCNIKRFKILSELTNLMEGTYPPERKRTLSTRDAIILTTAKLKLDIFFNALAIFFKPICVMTIRNTFYDTVKKLASILQAVIRRVSKEEVLRNMPKCFEKFQARTSVLDCTEIKLQKPKYLKCQIKFYSHYKSNLTVKFMTEVTPAGSITFVCKSFGGRASDKAIFNHSGVLQHV